MSLRMSLSESLQISGMMDYQFQSQTTQSILRHNDQQQQQQHQQKYKLGICTQILLAAAFCGVEMNMSFEIIYEVLMLQYVGVPVSMMSLNGVIAGTCGLVILPLQACFSDSGSNPMRRKILIAIGGLHTFLLGDALLLVSGLIKMNELSDIPSNLYPTTATTRDLTHNFSESTTLYSNTTCANVSTWSNEEASTSQPLVETGPLGPKVYLAILSFALLDMGFDINVSMIRAYIVEVVPQYQNSSILIIATATQAVTGMCLCFIGMWDIPDAMDSLFGVDGTAATLICFCVLLMIVTFISFCLTFITGSLTMKRRRGEKSYENSVDCFIENPENTEYKRLRYNKVALQKSQEVSTLPLLSHEPDNIQTEIEDELLTKPLLLKESLNDRNYKAISFRTNSLLTRTTEFEPPKEDSNRQNAHSDMEQKRINKQPAANKNDIISTVDSEACLSMSASVVELLREPLIQSTSLTKVRDKKASEKLEDGGDMSNNKVNKRFFVICMSAFFAFGALLSFVVYIPNAVTIGILHGDPTALPGTQGSELYQKGLRKSALGTFILYMSFTVASLLGSKLIDWIGERSLYVITVSSLICAQSVLIIIPRMEMYYLVMVLFGAFRMCLFTVIYILANKFVCGDSTKEKPGEKKASKSSGQVMSVIGLLLPLHYMILSAIMGPAIDATGNVWLPIIYCTACHTASLFSFCLLFFIRK